MNAFLNSPKIGGLPFPRCIKIKKDEILYNTKRWDLSFSLFLVVCGRNAYERLMCSFHCTCVAATSSALIEGHTHRQPWGLGVVGMSLMV